MSARSRRSLRLLVALVVTTLATTLAIPATLPSAIPAAQAYWYGPPRDLTATDLGGGRTQFSWSPPELVYYKGQTPTSYWVTIRTSSWRTYYCEGAQNSYKVLGTSCVVAGLPYGETVTVQVQAWDPYVGDDLQGTFTLCCETPAAPGRVLAAAADSSASVAWDPPTNAGRAGQEFTYSVEVRPGGLVCTTTARSCQVNGLVNGTEYTFYVAAANKTGKGGAAASAPVTPIGPPGPPGTVQGFLLDKGRVTVSWQGPANTGGTPITRYVAVSDPGGMTCESAGDLECEMSGLSNGTAYTFTVTAFNPAGQSQASAPSAPAKVLAGPGKPRAVKAVRKGRSATITWQAPASTGGVPVIGYTVAASPGGRTCAVKKASGCTIAGLAEGESYVFSVQARNTKGVGLPAVSNRITVPAPPRPPAPAPEPPKDEQTFS